MGNNVISQNGLNLIKGFEAFCASPYLDQAGIPTIGYGFTSYPNGTYVTMQDASITISQACAYLYQILMPFESCINKNVNVVLNQNQFDALCSFIYNIGQSSFLSSTLLKVLNNGNYALAGQHFMDWVKITQIINGIATKVTSNGLVNRRHKEQQLFLEPIGC